MIIDSNEYELLSNNMYYLKAKSLLCTIETQSIDEIKNTFVVIEPYEFKNIILDNNRLNVGWRTSGGREFLETKGILNKEECEELLEKFRGLIIGYPYFQLSVNISGGTEPFECDVIRIKGGFKNQFPYCGYSEFSVDFISLQRNGTVGIVTSLKTSDIAKKFTVTKVPKVGQILSIKNRFLCPSDLKDYINGVKTSYMGTPLYNWEEVKGNVTGDSFVSSLSMTINFDSKIGQLFFSENLYKRTYEIISHSSMDPGNDECTESTDRYIWGTFGFNEFSFINLIKEMSQSHLVSSLSESYIKFKVPIKKSDFTKLTGIYLFESIIHSSYRY